TDSCAFFPSFFSRLFFLLFFAPSSGSVQPLLIFLSSGSSTPGNTPCASFSLVFLFLGHSASGFSLSLLPPLTLLFYVSGLPSSILTFSPFNMLPLSFFFSFCASIFGRSIKPKLLSGKVSWL